MALQSGPSAPARQDGPPTRVVILGAGFGGLAVALALRNGPAEVTLVDRQNCHVFQPLLYQVASGALTPSEVAEPVRELFRFKPHVRYVADEMLRVDRRQRRVICRSGEYPFDYLVVATGSQYDYFGNEAWREQAPPLKSLKDAIQIRERIFCCFEKAELAVSEEERRRLLAFAVIGGGATGVELSGAIADLARSSFRGEYRSFDPAQAKIRLFEAQQTLLPGFSERLQAYTARALGRKGVEVVLNAPVTDLGEGTVKAGERSYEAGTVFWAAGVTSGDIAARLGEAAASRGRVDVREDFSLPGDDSIYVIGDAARALDEDGQPLPALAAVAQQQGEFLGRRLKRLLDGEEDQSRFRYRDRGLLATIGQHAAVAQFGRLKFTGLTAWLLWGLVHIYLLIGFRNRMMVFMNWVWTYLTRRRGNGLIIGSVPALTDRKGPGEADRQKLQSLEGLTDDRKW